MILFPAIDLKDGQCVRLKLGDMDQATVYNADPAAQARSFRGRRASNGCMSSISTAPSPASRSMAHAVDAILDATNNPVQLGGGIRTLTQIERWLDKGICPRHPRHRRGQGSRCWSRKPASCFPARSPSASTPRAARLRSKAGRKRSTLGAIELAQRFEGAGVAAMIYTDIDRDGVLGRHQLGRHDRARRGGDHPGHRLRRPCLDRRHRALGATRCASGSRARSPAARSMTAASIRARRWRSSRHAGEPWRMTLKARVIPCLDVKDGRVVKGVNFVDLVDAGDPVEAAKAYDAAGADELCFLDITASAENARHHLRCRGAHRRALLHAADGRRRRAPAGRHPQAAARRRRQGIDQHCGRASTRISSPRRPTSSATSASSSPSMPRSVSAGRCERAAGRSSPMAGATRPASTRSTLRARMVDRGAGEILLTSMDRDGTKAGYDIALTRAVADAVRVPVIASGGVGTLDHLVEGIRDGHATAVLAASIFHFGTYSIGEAKRHMAAPGCRCALGLSRARAVTMFSLADLETDHRASAAAPASPNPGRPQLFARGMERPPRSSARRPSRPSSPRSKQDRARPDFGKCRSSLSLAGRALRLPGCRCKEVMAELARRTPNSGTAEKASRKGA